MMYFWYRLAAWISRVLPAGLAYWVGLRVADLFYRFNPAGRRAVMRNLGQIFAAQQIVPCAQVLQGFTRKTFQYFGKYLVDFFRFSSLSPEDVRQCVSTEHFHYIEEAHRAGRGAILLTAHFGNWELAGGVVAAKGIPLNAVVLPMASERLNRLFQKQREKRGLKVILLGKASAVATLRCLKKGEMVALLADRDFTASGRVLPLFKRPASLPRGPAWLAMKTGAPIICGFLSRQVDDSFLLRIYPPLDPRAEASEEALHTKIAGILENEIRMQPCQWFIFDDFWQARPAEPAVEAGT